MGWGGLDRNINTRLATFSKGWPPEAVKNTVHRTLANDKPKKGKII
jgi:hypothetical protein